MLELKAVILIAIFLAFGLFIILLCCLRLFRPYHTIIHMRQTEHNQKLVDECPMIKQYRPTPWMINGHIQTIFSDKCRKIPRINFTRILLPVSNNGQIALDWSTIPVRNQPVLLICHGLVGGSHTAYIRWMVKFAHKTLNLCCVIHHARGCGRSQLASPTIFSGVFTSDLHKTIQYIRSIIGSHTPLFGLGYSYGAGTLTKYIGEQMDRCSLTAAISCCASYDYVLTANKLEKGLNTRTYNKQLTQTLISYLKSHENQFKDSTHLNLRDAYKARTMRQYDTATAVPLFGYDDVIDYYKEGSSAQWIQHIRIPTLLLSALDDPICCIKGLPLSSVCENEYIIAVLTKEGGHVGWLQGWWPAKYTWENTVIIEYIRAILKERNYVWHEDDTNDEYEQLSIEFTNLEDESLEESYL